MKICPYFAWYDFRVGAFYDRGRRILYVQFIPCCGIKIIFEPLPSQLDKAKFVIFERVLWYVLIPQLQKVTGWCDG